LVGEKIEDLGPHYETVLQALRYGLEISEQDTVSDKDKVSRMKHQIKDAMHILGYTDELVKTYRK
jgi:hypothetical protein